MRTLTAFLLVVSAAWGQDAPSPEPRPEAPRQEASRRDRDTDSWVNMLKERLQLSEDQSGKIRELLKKESEERSKVEEARTAQINEILNEQQKKQYEEVRQNPFGGGTRRSRGGNQGGGPRAGRFGQVRMEDLKTDLELTDEQVGKIQPIVDEFNAKGQKRSDELRNSGFRNFNWQEELQKAEDQMKEAGDKLKPLLTEVQKEKFDKFLEGRMSMVRMARGFAQGGTPTPGGAVPRLSPEARVKQAMEALKIEGEEDRKAISDLVTDIVKIQSLLEDQNKAVREKLQAMGKDSGLSDEAIEDTLTDIRKERRQKEKELAGLQKEVSECVNNRQEVELILLGILK